MKNNNFDLIKKVGLISGATFSFQFAILLMIFITSCNGQNQRKSIIDNVKTTSSSKLKNIDSQIVKPKNGFNCGFLDSKGNLWFGSNGGGVYRYDGRSFEKFTEEDGLSNNQICAITEDKNGDLWFGTARGLSRYDRKNFTTIAIPQSDTSSVWLDKVFPIVNPNQVMSLLQDKKGDFWIGTNGAGVYRYDGKTFTQYLSNIGKVYEDSLQHNIVLSITEDLSGNLWFTSLSHGGVSRFNGDQFTHFKTEDGLSDNFVRTSYCDKKGNIWIGTHGNRNGGLDRFDGSKFTNFRKTDDGLPQNNIMRIFEDKAGDLWLGGGRDNLSIFDGKHFKEFITKDGQTFDLILFILEDSKDNVWFGGSNGLWRLEGETLIDLIRN